MPWQQCYNQQCYCRNMHETKATATAFPDCQLRQMHGWLQLGIAMLKFCLIGRLWEQWTERRCSARSGQLGTKQTSASQNVQFSCFVTHSFPFLWRTIQFPIITSKKTARVILHPWTSFSFGPIVRQDSNFSDGVQQVPSPTPSGQNASLDDSVQLDSDWGLVREFVVLA